jgi:hypothetical protein
VRSTGSNSGGNVTLTSLVFSNTSFEGDVAYIGGGGLIDIASLSGNVDGTQISMIGANLTQNVAGEEKHPIVFSCSNRF